MIPPIMHQGKAGDVWPVGHFFALRPESEFRETSSRFAVCATFLGVRFILAATASTRLQ
jgi:hypothetical protein